jgi:hypothetical protein
VQLNGTLRGGAKFKHMGMMPTNQNCIHKEIKSRLNSDNAHYHSVQNLLLSCPLSKNIQIKICKTIILHAVLYGCKTSSLTSREEQRLWVFEEMILGRVPRPINVEATGRWRTLHNKIIICSPQQILLE